MSQCLLLNQFPLAAKVPTIKPWVQFQYKDGLSRNGDLHHNDKTVRKPSYHYNEDPYTYKTRYSYWDTPQIRVVIIINSIKDLIQ